MAIIRHDSAAAFLAATEDFRAADPLLTNIMGSVASGVLAGRVYESELWLTVHDEAGLIGMAMRTAPWNLVGLGHAAGGRRGAGPVRRRRRCRCPRGDRTARGRRRRDHRARTRRRTAPADRHGRRPACPHHAPSADRRARCRASERRVRGRRPARSTGIARSPRTLACRRTASRSPSGPAGPRRRAVDLGGRRRPRRDGRACAPGHHAGRRGRPHRSGLHAGCTCAAGGTAPQSPRRSPCALLPRCSTVMLFADAAKPEVNRMYARLGFEESARIVEVRLDA